MSIFKTPMKNNFPMINRDRVDYDLYKEFENFFSRNIPTGLEMIMPKVDLNLNIQESKEGYHLEAELPGVKKEDVNVSMKDDCLVIKGEKRSFNEEKKDQYHRIERGHGSFYRAIVLPKDVDKEKINAELKDGILKVDVMKTNHPITGEKKININ